MTVINNVNSETSFIRQKLKKFVTLQHVILQQQDEMENFAQLKEFVSASTEETPTSNAQK